MNDFKTMRLELGLSQSQAAELLEVSTSTVQKWERATRNENSRNCHPRHIKNLELRYIDKFESEYRKL